MPSRIPAVPTVEIAAFESGGIFLRALHALRFREWNIEKTPAQLATNLQERYWPTGYYLAHKLFVVRGLDIDSYLRQSAEATDLEQTHPLSTIGASIDDILPDPDTLESMHLIGNVRRSPMLTDFVAGQLALRGTVF